MNDMTTILTGRAYAKQIKDELRDRAQVLPAKSFLAIINTSDNQSSAVYVSMKQKFGQAIGLGVRCLSTQTHTKTQVESLIFELNQDDHCRGIILQLPLKESLQPHTQHLCSLIAPSKDVDGLGGILTGLASTGLIEFLPATPHAVLALLDYYQIMTGQGVKIAILGQSNLVGKPLNTALINRGATTYSFNQFSDQEEMKRQCRHVDIIISCTGKVHLVNQEFVGNQKMQTLIDVGYGHKDGKAVGDVDFDTVVDRVKAITPVPGGVGPLTVAKLFENTIFLHENKDKLALYLR